MYFETKGLHTRLYYVLKRVCNPDTSMTLNNICNKYTIELEVAKMLTRYSNYEEYIAEHGIESTIQRIKDIEKEKEVKSREASLALPILCSLVSRYKYKGGW